MGTVDVPAAVQFVAASDTRLGSLGYAVEDPTVTDVPTCAAETVSFVQAERGTSGNVRDVTAPDDMVFWIFTVPPHVSITPVDELEDSMS